MILTLAFSENLLFRVSNNIPEWFNQVVCGLMLSDANIRMHGKHATMSIQQTHKELTE